LTVNRADDRRAKLECCHVNTSPRYVDVVVRRYIHGTAMSYNILSIPMLHVYQISLLVYTITHG